MAKTKSAGYRDDIPEKMGCHPLHQEAANHG
jgi:hypothetical protein